MNLDKKSNLKLSCICKIKINKKELDMKGGCAYCKKYEYVAVQK